MSEDRIPTELLREIAAGHFFSVSDETVIKIVKELLSWRLSEEDEWPEPEEKP